MQFRARGSGHYDAVAHFDTVQDKNNFKDQKLSIFCQCGRNSKDGKEHFHLVKQEVLFEVSLP